MEFLRELLFSQLIPIEIAAKSIILLDYSWRITFFFDVTEGEWVRGEKKGKGVVGKFFFRIVCQNHIPFSLSK